MEGEVRAAVAATTSGGSGSSGSSAGEFQKASLGATLHLFFHIYNLVRHDEALPPFSNAAKRDVSFTSA